MLRIVPKRFHAPLRQFKHTALARLAQVLSKSTALSAFYYAVVGSLRLEQQAILAGRAMYHQSTQKRLDFNPHLRRCIHRLEKGLLMRPRRDVFGQSYIVETVNLFSLAATGLENATIIPTELQWAHDVLEEYFSVVGHSEQIDKARHGFRLAQVRMAPSTTSVPLIPYARNLAGGPPVKFADFANLAHRRRSVRWFLPQGVPRQLIDDAIMVAGQSPTACNRQPFEFLVYDDSSLVQQIATLPGGTGGFAHNIPSLVVLVAKHRHFFHERDRHLGYIDASLAAMAFIFAIETTGLSTCAINWPDVPKAHKAAAKLIGLDADERLVMLIAVGYPDPDGLVASSAKKELAVFRQYNRTAG